jgi:hypothetical protein
MGSPMWTNEVSFATKRIRRDHACNNNRNSVSRCPAQRYLHANRSHRRHCGRWGSQKGMISILAPAEIICLIPYGCEGIFGSDNLWTNPSSCASTRPEPCQCCFDHVVQNSRVPKNRLAYNFNWFNFDVDSDGAQLLCFPMKAPLEASRETIQNALDDVSGLIFFLNPISQRNMFCGPALIIPHAFRGENSGS